MSVAVSTHHAHVFWERGSKDVRAHKVQVGEQEIPMSSMPENGGDPSRGDPEELLVAALSSCHMLWFLHLARRERLRVERYEDEAEGTLAGNRFERTVLRPRVEFEGVEPPPDLLDELHHRAHELCYIANSVNFPVEVEPR